MPLPTGDLEWPPKALTDVASKLDEWSTWYAGDPSRLHTFYSAASGRSRSGTGGVAGALRRLWWGRPATDLSVSRTQLHVPVAADLCQASADLLYSERPRIKVEEQAATDRVDRYLDEGLHNALAEAAEIGAALGSSYLRVTWDQDLLDVPFLTNVHADSAWPEFRYGRLTAVTFWRVVADDGQVYRRHLERHELDANGVGVILHGLYEGTRDRLGRVVPLTETVATEPLARLVDADGLISTGSPGLAVQHVPNQRPQRTFRSHPIGAHLGRSDLDGIEGAMDALDEAWSSWMRDLRLGKARILAARSALEVGGPGQGAAFDTEREVYEALNVLGSRDSGLPIEPVQFQIRVDEHARTVDQLMQVILRSAGYSSQSFGEDDGGAAATATEVQARERRSFLTRDRKLRHQVPAVARLVEKMLAVDAAVFGTAVTAERPSVDLGDSVQDSPLQLATTVEMLSRARMVSTRTGVEMAHPDWDEERVAEEVAAIGGEVAVDDPTTAVPFGAVADDPVLG